MKILYVGNFIPTHSTENDIRWTLEDMGHPVTAMQENACSWNSIVSRGKQHDLVLFTHTPGYEPQTRSISGQLSGILELEKSGVPTASFHLDLFVGLPRQSMIRDHWSFHTQYFFGVDGDPKSAEVYENNGVNHIWIKPGIAKKNCFWGKYDDGRCADITFVGSAPYHKEWPHRLILLSFLSDYAKEKGFLFRKWGNPERTVRGPELNDIYMSSEVVVGDTLCLAGHKNYWSDRLYETLGRGGFLIMPFVDGMEAEFEDDHHLRYYQFGDFKSLASILDQYLLDSSLMKTRNEMALNGFNKVKDHCTYHNRMEFLLDTIARKGQPAHD